MQKIKYIIKKIIGFFGYRVVDFREFSQPQRQAPLKFKHFLDLYFSRVDPNHFFFVQVGAHDGKHHDPLHRYVTKYNLHGIALEPQPDIYSELVTTYKNYPTIVCVDEALAEKTGAQLFYTSRGATSLGTFDKRLLVGVPDVEEILVKTITFKDLVERFNVNRIDFLQIDCEGYDFEVLKMFDFEKFDPQIINFESVLFSDETRRECEELLKNHGYILFRYERDTCAYKI